MRCAVAGVLGTTMMFVSLHANAQSTNEAEALRTFEEGRKLYEAHAYDDALRAFRASLEAMPSPNSRLYVARCYREKGLVASAFSTFRIASREAEDRVRATGDTRYVATQKSAAFEADRLAALVPRVTLALEPGIGIHAADVESAVVDVDGARVSHPRLGHSIELDPGTHTIAVSGRHIRRAETRIELAPRDTKTVTLHLEHAPFGTLRVVFKSLPRGLAAELDGEPIDVASRDQTREVIAGAHRLTARAPGYGAFVWEARVDDAALVDVVVDLPASTSSALDSADNTRSPAASRGTPKWLFFTTAGAALVAGGVGAVLLADAHAKDSEEAAKIPSARDADRRDGIRAEAQASSVLFVSAGALAVTATVLGITTRWRTERPHAVGIAPGPFAGAQLVGAF